MTNQRGKATAWVLILVVLLAIAGGAWWYFNQGSMRIAISKAQILERLSEKLPVTKTYLYVFKVTYDSPRVELIETSKRINAGLDVSIDISFLDSGAPLRGQIDASAGVRYSPAQGAFYLEDPTVEQIELEGLPDEWADKGRELIEQGVSSYFRSRPIYTLNERQSGRAAKAVLQDVTIEQDRVILHLGDPQRGIAPPN